MGGSPPGSAGVPPAQILPQLRPSPPPESTGSGALPLLRQGGRLHHRRETKRQPKGQHAGGTPALPGVSSRWRGGGYPAGDFSESRPVPFGKLPFACEPGARPPRLGGSYEGETGFVSGKSGPRPHDGAHHSEGKQPFVNEDEPPMNTNRHEDRWTSFNDNWRQNASALLSRWCDPVMGGSPPGSAGVPPAQILPQLQPSPPPESTGSGALPLLRPGGRLQHRRETKRQPKGQHAGGTPALPGVSSRW